jgi:tetratricopeptide (TPR) repeat protein
MRHFNLLLFFVLFSPIMIAQHDDPLAQIRLLLINKKYQDLLLVTDSLELPESMKAEVYFYRGTAFRELSRYDSALYYYQQALKGDSTNLSYKITLGKTYHSFGWIWEAIRVFEEVIREDSLDRQSRLDLAALYMIRKKYIKSLELYQYLLAGDSLNYFLSKQAGICFLETGQQDSALHYFERAFFLNPADVYLTQQIANIYIGKEQLDKAFSTVQKGIVHDTSHADLLSLRGYLWYLNNNHTLAIKDLEASASQYSSSVFTYKYLGLALIQEKQFEEARMALLNAHRLDSLDITIIFSLGYACRWSGFEDEAIHYYQRAIQLLQSSLNVMKKAHVELAELYTDLDQFDNALEAYQISLSYDARDNLIFYKMAQIYDYYLNRKEIAIKYYEKYLSGKNAVSRQDNIKDPETERLVKIVQSRINYLKESLDIEE